MPATGAKRGNLIYHWKHGWIPLDHFAALSKAKGNHKAAAKIMERHGISGGHGSQHAHPIGAMVAARQPGIERETHGKVVGHDAHGFLKVEHTDRKGNTLVGTFNPEHARVVGSAKPHPAPHTLKVGDHATVAGKDEFGSDTHFTGTVRGNTSVTVRRGSSSTPMRSIAVEHTSATTGNLRTDHVLVPDPNRVPAKITAAREAAAKVRDLPADGEFKGVHSETYRGNKISVRKGRDWGTLQTSVNGNVVSPSAFGRTNGHATRELDGLRSYIDMAHKDPGSYGIGTDRPTWGMKLEKAAKLDPHAIRATQLREAAAKKRAEADRIAGSVGAPDRAGAMLRAKDSARMNARMDSGLRKYTEAQRQAKALESKAHLADGRSKTAAEKQAAADLGVTASKLSPGDLIQHKGSAHTVTKVNKTTVSVPSIVGGPWEDKLPIAGISKHIKVADMKESTLRTLLTRAKGNPSLEAVYAAELKRRGLRVAS